MAYKFFDKKTRSAVNVKKELAGELHKPVIKKFKRRRAMRDLNTRFTQQI